MRRNERPERPWGLPRPQAYVEIAASLVEDVPSFMVKQKDKYDELKASMMEFFDEYHEVVYNAYECMVPQNRRRLVMIGASGIDVSGGLAAVKRQQDARKSGVSTHPTVAEALAGHRKMARLKGIYFPHLRGAVKGGDNRPRRIRSTNRYYTTITSGYGARGGMSEQCWQRYVECEADQAPKAKSFNPTGAELGVLSGFSFDAPWSLAQSCKCPGCVTPSGRSRGRPGDIERGNVISPPQWLLLIGPIVRAASGVKINSGRATTVDGGDEHQRTQALQRELENFVVAQAIECTEDTVREVFEDAGVVSPDGGDSTLATCQESVVETVRAC